MIDPKTDLCYPVLTPFKFRGVVVKPPALVQMSVEEAHEYQDAGVLGNEDVAALPPEPENDGTPESQASTETHAEAEAATEVEAPDESAAEPPAEAHVEVESPAEPASEPSTDEPVEAEAASEVEAAAPTRPAAKTAKTTSKKAVK